jgi:hypothetical protein
MVVSRIVIIHARAEEVGIYNALTSGRLQLKHSSQQQKYGCQQQHGNATMVAVRHMCGAEETGTRNALTSGRLQSAVTYITEQIHSRSMGVSRSMVARYNDIIPMQGHTLLPLLLETRNNDDDEMQGKA